MELGRGWVDDAVFEWFSKPANRDRKAFKRSAEWVVRLASEKARELVGFVSPRIRTETLWHDARDIVKRLRPTRKGARSKLEKDSMAGQSKVEEQIESTHKSANVR
jgi:hypothetical protein